MRTRDSKDGSEPSPVHENREELQARSAPMPACADQPELSKADYEALAAFRLALRRFLAFSDAAIRETGVTPQQHQALLAIKACRDESLTVGALAEALLLQHHSGVELANRLEAAGLVARHHDPEDRRRVLLTLTPDAERLLAGLASVHLRELSAMRPMLLQALEGLGGA